MVSVCDCAGYNRSDGERAPKMTKHSELKSSSGDGDVIVVGACGGIGAAVTSALRSRDYRVVGIDIRETAPTSSFEQGLWRIAADIGSEAGIGAAAALLARASLSPKAIVWAAGSFERGTVSTTDEASWHTTLQMHLIAPAMFIRAALTLFIPPWRVVLMGSIAAQHALGGQAAYAAAKAGLESLARSLRAEAGSSGIHATLLRAGAVSTAAWDSSPQFDRSRMLSPVRVAQVIADLITLPLDARVDELTLLPEGGIL
jgi:NAD(P)-dependent dehydrogenase (short-subunit alcohol dehydrogenase family)